MLCADVEHYLHFNVDDALDTLESKVHEVALFLDADNLLDDGDGLGLVEKTHDGGLYLLHDVAPGFQTGGHSREEESAVLAALGLLVETERRLGDDAECALGADEYLVEIGAGCMFGNGQCVYDVAVRENDLHAHAHVVDLAVLGGENTYAAVAERAADGAAGQAGGNVHAGIALLVGVPLELLEDHSGLGGDGVRVLIKADEVVHALHVEQDAARHGQRAAL